jgi:hypothetical protein
MSEANNEIQQVILQELRSFRSDVSTKLDDHVQRLTAVETKLEPLLGNGQPGLITKMQDDIGELKKFRYYFVGALMALEGLGHWLGRKLGLV